MRKSGSPKRLTTAEESKVRSFFESAKYQAGDLPISEIAEAVNCSTATIRGRAEQWEIPLPSEIEIEEVDEITAVAPIGKSMGVSLSIPIGCQLTVVNTGRDIKLAFSD